MFYTLKVYMLVAFFVFLPVAALYLAGVGALLIGGSFRRIKAAYRTRPMPSPEPALPVRV